MFKILFCLLFDCFFLYLLGAYWSELGWYNLLILGIAALFTFELIRAIKSK
jgi:hypothetical protein